MPSFLSPPSKFVASIVLLAVWPCLAQASPQLALDKGCYSCHGYYLRGEAPSFERLQSKLSNNKGDDAAEQKYVNRFLAGAPLQHIDGHERLTHESATTLIHWLSSGGK